MKKERNRSQVAVVSQIGIIAGKAIGRYNKELISLSARKDDYETETE